MARLSMTMFLLRVNAVVYGQMDKAILGIFLSTSALAHYDVAARFHSLVLVSMGLVSSVVLSTSAALNAANDHANLKRLFLLGTRFSVACSVPLALGLMVLARPLLQIWVGPHFVGDAYLVWLFLAYTLFWGMKEVGWNMMIGIGHAPEILRIQLWTTSLNLVTSALATYRFGIAGVLIGTLAGNAVALVCYLYLYLPTIRVSLREFVQEVVTPVYPQAAVAGAVLAWVSLTWVPTTLAEVASQATGFATLFLLLFALTGLQPADRLMIRSLLEGWRAR